eukprot:TRINITY_DN5887_c0_g1_i2.p1 TRINITY_DN5887_c0_g1~~TRINITY_DN5887_c0_g1_i2.p1  ORF type:complete len:387 (-),score=137.58 TRINITY_DN5887_c0_g1_i2:62-1222(-)
MLGNAGTTDQQLALQWVAKNAASFGGDPDGITIFGQSAGGNSIFWHYGAPDSIPFFRAAIAESGFYHGLFPKEEALTQGRAFAEQLGCSPSELSPSELLQCVRNVPSSELVRANALSGCLSLPAVDGVTVMWPDDAVREGRASRAPVLLGATRDEGSLIGAIAKDITATQLRLVLTGLFGPAHTKVILNELYPLSSYPSPAYAFSAIYSDWNQHCPNRKFAQLLTSASTPAFLYQWSYAPRDNGKFYPPNVTLGAFHAAEVPFVFHEEWDFNEEEQVLSLQTREYWTSHAARGFPAGDESIDWPQYNATADLNMNLDAPSLELQRGMGLDPAKCDFWDNVVGVYTQQAMCGAPKRVAVVPQGDATSAHEHKAVAQIIDQLTRMLSF